MQQLLPLIDALNKAGVKYVVVGGLAVIFHGHPRLTTDIDLVFGLDKENALKAIRTLTGLGYKAKIPVNPEDFADEDVRKGWISQKGLVVFSMYHPTDVLTIIDIFVEEPIPFESMMKDSVLKEVDGVEIRLASIEHLIHMKEKAGRPKDLDDIKVLKIIKGQ